MIKRYTAILCMLIACAVIFGHGVVPHSHSHHHVHDDHQHEQEQQDWLGFMFSQINHAPEGIVSIKTGTVQQSLQEKQEPVNHKSYSQKYPDPIEVPLTTFKHYRKVAVFESPPLSASGLRGPPSFIV